MIFSVINKETGVEVTRYAAAQVAELDWPFAEFDHVEYVEDAVAPPHSVMTKLEYLRLFTAEERITIRTVAKTNVILEDYLSMLELADEINTGDPDTIAAVYMLEQAGLIATGRASEVLNGL